MALPPTSYTACHDCLFTLDLLDEIMHHLGQVQDPPDHWHDVIPSRSLRRSLLAFGLTCRALCEPALRVLWHRLDDLVPLLKLLPRFVVIPGQHWSVKGMLAPRDWILFDKYAVWVKEVVLDTNVLLDDHTIMLLATHRCPILPNLILFKCPRWLYVVWQVLFLGAPLVETDDPAAHRGIARALAGPRRLTHLTLSHFSSYFNTFPAGFECLQSLHIVDPQPFRGAHRPSQARLMPSLLSLTISFATTETPIATFVLPSLRHLRLRSGASWALHFLQTLESRDMESLALRPLGNAWPDGAAQGIADVVAARWARTLRAFTIELAAERIHDLAALAACPHVARFALRAPTGGASTKFDIAAFLGIALPWTRLRALSLPASAGIDLACLSRFAALWPALTFLELNLVVVDPVRVPPPRAGTPGLGHGLKHLVLHSAPQHWQDADAGLLAHHLDRLFPRLDSVRGGAGEESPCISASRGIGVGVGGVHGGAAWPWATVLGEVFRCQDARRLEMGG
ncbi:hypothetical protein C8F04DRAFT_1234716 [Mycena alexandri]|uniref:F-box domain-containing protein n=1 Tax=Mycena alexandri TaxID=1745969 RepID=A0AAD6SWT9_9AGAR|nr:hypothetical protein C8F04DRAFT_1234716 [Mycena alexandri]